jgi:putative nucleotidyltransferase with HDIG domain
MAPALPNFFAFGVLGALVGQLYSELNLLSLVLLVVPALIARGIYRSSLELQQAREDTIRVFMKALEAKDLYTARHTDRVAKYAGYIGEDLGFDSARLTHLRHAALMHDIGKMAVSSDLLNKPGRLTEEEYGEIRRHNEVCVEILTCVEFLRSTIPVAQDQHGFFNEDADRNDPNVIEGFAVAVADAFDAMTSTRAYRKALTQEVAFAELHKGKGRQFDPACVDALIAAIERRGETFGAGCEVDIVEFAVEPPEAGVGSAGLGDLEPQAAQRGTSEQVRRASVFPFRAD